MNGRLTRDAAGHARPGPLAPLEVLVRNRSLAARLTLRDVESRHKGSVLGWLWPFLAPLCLAGVYAFVFTRVFPAAWQESGSARAGFVPNIYAGLLAYAFVAETLARAPGLLRENASYLKKFVFPVEVLPWTATLAGLFQAGCSLAALYVLTGLIGSWPGLTALWALPALASLALGVLGLSYALSAVGLFWQDLKHLVAVANLANMFAVPVFYPVSAFPEGWRFLLWLNPAAWPIECLRRAMLESVPPDPLAMACHAAGCLTLAWAGYALFAKLRPEFADVV